MHLSLPSFEYHSALCFLRVVDALSLKALSDLESLEESILCTKKFFLQGGKPATLKAQLEQKLRIQRRIHRIDSSKLNMRLSEYPSVRISKLYASLLANVASMDVDKVSLRQQLSVGRTMSLDSQS